MVLIRNASTYRLDKFKNTFLFLFILFFSCGRGTKLSSQTSTDTDITVLKDTILAKKTVIDSSANTEPIIIGANQTELYLPLLKDKRVAIVGNQTSVIFKFPNLSALLPKEKNTPSILTECTHLVDSLLKQNINIKKVFAPEHGFRGKADAAELIADGKDIKTGLPIISLYSKNKKPSAKALADIDIIIFDIQDVGVRFYTYISTLHYVMQACAENNVKLLILDRPNPNGHYIDGPTLQMEHTSFVGVHPIPVVHGMTIGEYATMANGEGWLGNELTCDIQVIPVKNYTHQTPYSLPIRPSPNLPNDKSINLYPSLGFFEGTTINAGRGTEMQFQIFGSPDFPIELYDFSYTPQSNFGAKYPKHKGEVCYGKDLRNTKRLSAIDLKWLLDGYKNSKNKETFFNTKSFTIHAGSKILQEQIIQGYSEEDIRETWKEGLEKYRKIRSKYLMYR
ncbi:DUF1343 domain-containing protein [Aquimarina addita]